MTSFLSTSSSKFFNSKLQYCLFWLLIGVASAQLSPNFYSSSCPNALSTIQSAVQSAINNETRMGASLLRLHFHDCFVNGCDGSILLDDTANFTGEKTAVPNLNSVRGFEVIDTIKSQVENVCAGVVSCADILAVAARDSVVALGGQNYTVLLGRRDSTTANMSAANSSLPAPTFNLSRLITLFSNHGFNAQELVALSGAHTIGQARCTTFRPRIYNDTNINSTFATSLQSNCPQTGGDNNTSPLDTTPNTFDNAYFNDLLSLKGLLHSDQELWSGNTTGTTDNQVSAYSSNSTAFFRDFSNAMIKMGNMSVLTGTSGEIRTNCRKPNSAGLNLIDTKIIDLITTIFNISNIMEFFLSSFGSKFFCFKLQYYLFLVLIGGASAQLTPNFYSNSCPNLLSTIQSAVRNEARMGASLLRLHFHDYFVNGCDGSILLNDTANFTGEQSATPNINSVRGFEVIDNITARVESICAGVVSCADILAVAARDSVVELGGPSWTVLLGRRDSTTANLTAANVNLPAPTMNISELTKMFSDKGLNPQDLVALSGAHTIGVAKCLNFQNCLSQDSNINPTFASSLQGTCPRDGSRANNTVPLDATPTTFDNVYFNNLLISQGLLHSDQELFNGTGSTDSIVSSYSSNSSTFFRDFANAMIKMGNIDVITGTNGEIRTSCWKTNTDASTLIKEKIFDIITTLFDV
ncbi:uncharacterized protein LOC110690628 [Chenopodium quinoa]|uniref:uncharacterized protein LOC110690628 n=1 Tax=Chenopodium quinoa TaxID=63459 RepID=UPI000B77D8B5|nr:uncharacterized protein LOC110690628 [Chenopodium quinoa]